eukprot:jgi/Mesen1/694/ME000109S_10912
MAKGLIFSQPGPTASPLSGICMPRFDTQVQVASKQQPTLVCKNIRGNILLRSCLKEATRCELARDERIPVSVNGGAGILIKDSNFGPSSRMCASKRRAPMALTTNFLRKVTCSSSRGESYGGNSDKDGQDAQDEHIRSLEEALGLDADIPASSSEFIEKVSSRAYEMRSLLEQSLETTSYDLLEANPWREAEKPVFVLAKEEDRLFTMRTRQARSEVESELSLLFNKRGSRRGANGYPRSSSSSSSASSVSSSTAHERKAAHSTPTSPAMGAGGVKGRFARPSKFRMHVEDIREGVLVFEDEDEAANYCSLLEGQGKPCLGVARLQAKEVFAMCQSSKALAVLFRRGITPPQPDRLQQNLKARKHSLED